MSRLSRTCAIAEAKLDCAAAAHYLGAGVPGVIDHLEGGEYLEAAEAKPYFRLRVHGSTLTPKSQFERVAGTPALPRAATDPHWCATGIGLVVLGGARSAAT